MTRWNRMIALAALAAVTVLRGAAAEEPALVEFKFLSPGTALEMAKAALENCRSSGYQVAVSVVDRFGTPQVLLRDQFAGPHTPETARRKAWTAVSFRSDTVQMAEFSSATESRTALRFIDDALMVGGGVPVEAAGSIVAGIGVSGAPGGEADDVCARAGIAAIADKIAF